jgi:hypothetical protein
VGWTDSCNATAWPNQTPRRKQTQAGALQALLATAAGTSPPPAGGRPPSSGAAPAPAAPAPPGQDGTSPVKIALFSIGNMCAHRECREALLNLGLRDALRQLSGASDPVLQKYLARVQAKLTVPQAGAPLTAGRAAAAAAAQAQAAAAAGGQQASQGGGG